MRRWDEWQRADAPTLRRYAGLQHFGPAGSELGSGRWAGVAELVPHASGHVPVDAHNATAPPDRRSLLAKLLSALSRWQHLPVGWADAELCAQLVRLDDLFERLRVASPAVRTASTLLSWALRLTFRLARPALLFTFQLAERLMFWLLAHYVRASDVLAT